MHFGQFLCPSSVVFPCTHSSGIYHTGLLCVQGKTPGQRNCLKHVEFHSKNIFEKLVHLVGFIIRNLSRCMVTWTSNSETSAHSLMTIFLNMMLIIQVFWEAISCLWVNCSGHFKGTAVLWSVPDCSFIRSA